MPIAGHHPIFQLFSRALIFIHSFSNEDGLDSGVAEDDSRGEEAVNDCDSHLHCVVSVLARRRQAIMSEAANSPILFPLDTSSCVYVDTTLCLLVVSGIQSLTGLKLILLCDMDSRVPSLPICNPSIELTRLKDILWGGQPS